MKQNILHAGGKIGVHTYTNSVEAVLRSIAIGKSLIELDCVRLADGFGFAHDGVEEQFYGAAKPFHQIPLQEFANLRVFGQYTPMTFRQLRDILLIAPHVSIVVDSKGGIDEFRDLLLYSRNEMGPVFSRLCFQVYDIPWTDALLEAGGRFGLPALWKFFDADPFSEAALAFLSHAAEHLPFALGVSLRWQNPFTGKRNLADPGLPKILERFGDVFFHGQDTDLRFHEQIALNKRFGFFISMSLRSIPADFDAAAYTQIHPDLHDMDAVRAMCHYVEFGCHEKRRYH